jgi:threonine dehydrogenase-like Zn-dependent dehydrogenase
MKALYFDGTRVALADRPEPVPAIGEVLVQVKRAGICATDLELAKGYMGFRGVLGHELLGEVDGRRVAAEINFACGHCPACRRNDRNHCPHRSVLGIVNHDGSLAERVAIPVSALHSVPAGLDDAAAAFAEPVAAALHVLDDLAPRRGERVCVVGDGKLGLLCALVLATTPAEVTLAGRHPEHLLIAHPEGVHTVLEPDLPRAPVFDAVVEATGSPSGLALALAILRPRGTLVLKSTYAGKPPLDLAPIVINEVRVLGSRCGSIDAALVALEEKLLDPRPLIAATYPIDRAEEAFARAGEKGVLKVVVAP